MVTAVTAESRNPLSPSAHAYPWTALAIGGIWLSVVLASILAPAMVTGSQHDHLPLAAFGDWIWGAIASSRVALVAVDGLRAGGTSRAMWTTLGITVVAIWVGVLLVSVFTPDFVTGSDPTRLPFGAMLSPIAGLVLTSQVCNFVKSGFQRPQSAPVEAVLSAARTTPIPLQQAISDDAAAKLRQLPALRETGAITEEEFEAKKRELLNRL